MGDDTRMGSSSTEETFNVEEQTHEPEPERPWIPGFPYESIFIGIAIIIFILISYKRTVIKFQI
jgi:hypothetical protein